MTDWSKLNDVGGSAEYLPELLEELAISRDPEIIQELWSRLCHQGSVYSASFAAVPELIRIAEQWYPSNDCLQLIHLATSILTGEDGDNLRRPYVPVEGESPPAWTTTADRIDVDSLNRKRYQTEIDALLRLLENYLQQSERSENEYEYEFADIICSIVSLRGYSSWGTALEYFAHAWSGWGGSCNICDEWIYIHNDYEETIAVVEKDGVPISQTVISPASPKSLTGIAQWLYENARDRGYDSVAKSVTDILGTGNCPECGAKFEVREIMEFTNLVD